MDETEYNELRDYILLMLSMKSEGKRVDFDHIADKARRDLGAERDEVEVHLKKLISNGLVEEVRSKFSASEDGRKSFEERINDETIEKNLRKINEPWVTVYKAKNYYPQVADTIIEFCKGRHVGFYTLFTEKRFFRRDFKGRKITISSPEDLLFYVNMHYIDVIPCVHRINMDRPDWLVADIDAGPKVSWEITREVTKQVHSVFEEFDLNPALKFSGSRGFQIWSFIDDFSLPSEYKPIELLGAREINFFTLFSDFVRVIQRKVDKILPGRTVSEVSRKKEREDRVLIDPSSMKPMGLVRAPYSIHSKTGLASMPLSLEELDSFEPEKADLKDVLNRYGEKGNEFKIKKASPQKIIDELLGFLLS